MWVGDSSDQRTKSRERLAYAMLCVKVNAGKVLPECLNIIVKGMEYELKLEYESSQIAARLQNKSRFKCTIRVRILNACMSCLIETLRTCLTFLISCNCYYL